MPHSADPSVTAPRAALHSGTSSATSTGREALLSASRTLPGRIALGLAATAIVAAAAHVSFPLPFTPVPFILTPLAVLGVGLAFGPIGGFLVLAAYLLEGACGLPVFSPTGPGGMAQLLGPTGGFLMSYPLVAFIAGLATRMSPRVPRFMAATLAGLAAIVVLFAFGAAWLAQSYSLLHGSAPAWRSLLLAAVLPFLPGEIVKVLAAAGVYSTLRRGR